MSKNEEMLVCGSCKSESHVSCVSSPGLARLLNPFICSTCVGYSDRPGGVGGGLSARDRSSSLDSSLGSFASSIDSEASPLSASMSGYPSSIQESPVRAGLDLSTAAHGLPSISLSPLPRPGGSIVNPYQKVFETRDQFILWAKAMFMTCPNKNAPMELKNT